MSDNTDDIAPQPGLYSEYAVNIADGLSNAFNALEMVGYRVKIRKLKGEYIERRLRCETLFTLDHHI